MADLCAAPLLPRGTVWPPPAPALRALRSQPSEAGSAGGGSHCSTPRHCGGRGAVLLSEARCKAALAGLAAVLLVHLLCAHAGLPLGRRTLRLPEDPPAPVPEALAASARRLAWAAAQRPGRLQGDVGGGDPRAEAAALRRAAQQHWLVHGAAAAHARAAEQGGAGAEAGEPHRRQLRRALPPGLSAARCFAEPPQGNATQPPDAEPAGDEAAVPAMSPSDYLRGPGQQVAPQRWCCGSRPQELPELFQVDRLRSSKPQGPAPGLAIVTQLSLERLARLDSMCSAWPHQVAAVLYIPLVLGSVYSTHEESHWHDRELDAVLDQLARWHSALDARPGGCSLDLEVVVEERCSASLAGMYPANAARNRALMLADTEAVLLLDVDFVPSREVAALGGSPARYAELRALLEDGAAVVLPAFEPSGDGAAAAALARNSTRAAAKGDSSSGGGGGGGSSAVSSAGTNSSAAPSAAERQLALGAAAGGKPRVAELYRSGLVDGFHMGHYTKGHGPTDFGRWVESSAPYEVEYAQGYEPYVIMLRRDVPWAHELLRGYFWNKVEHLMHVALQGRRRLVVHPAGFVVHVPHQRAPMRALTIRSGQKEHNRRLFYQAKEDILAGRFVPVTAFPELCLPPLAEPAPGSGAPSPLDLGLLELVAHRPPSRPAAQAGGSAGGALDLEPAAEQQLPAGAAAGLEEGPAARLGAAVAAASGGAAALS